MNTGEKIKKLREENKKDQKFIAKIADVTEGAVSQWESGITEPRLGKLQKIAKYFNLNTSDLLGDEHTLQQPTPIAAYSNTGNPKKDIIINTIKNYDIPDNILDLISAAIEPYKK